MTVRHARAIVAVLALVTALVPETRLHAQQEPTPTAELRASAEQGDADAQYNLGIMYVTGRGVPQDDAEAVRWYLLAADQGHAVAQFNLGIMYAYGRGVLQDDAEVLRWYRLAADQGLAGAQASLGSAYSIGLGVPRDDAEAARWYRLAADQGDANAQGTLGRMYAAGRGVPQNNERAYMWFSVAADNHGHKLDIKRNREDRDYVSKDFTPEQQARAEALATTCFTSTFTDCGEPE